MANIYRKKVVSIDPKTGKRTERLSGRWWARYRDAEGIMRRVSLASSKALAQRMLAEIVEKIELQKSGVMTQPESESKRPIAEHLAEFEAHLHAKNDTKRHVRECRRRLERMVKYCGWRRITDISASSVEEFLAHLRNDEKMSISTSNHYLRAVRTFCNWLVAVNRLVRTPLKIVKTLNERVDQRHHRRALGDDEFSRLIEAAERGGPACGLSGPDRAMLYILAAWTGFRRGELGSLTLRNFDIVSTPPTVRIEAAYSKHRREDVQVLHPDLVDRLVKWVTRRRFPEAKNGGMDAFLRLQQSAKPATELLFQVSERAGAVDRRTSKMMRRDLEAARRAWIHEADDMEERQRREESDFLRYRNSAGRFADFHGLRHTFISNLGRAGVSPKTAQVLARHSDISLTMNIYSHVDQAAQMDAINQLPGIPGKRAS